MTIKFLRSSNHLSLNLIRPGVCIVAFGLMYRRDPVENTRWIGPTPPIKWVDNHKIQQAMRTWWLGHRLWMTISGSSFHRLTDRQARKLTAQR